MSKRLSLGAIKDKYNNLTNKEKKTADYILNNSEAVVSMTIAQLSERTGTAKSAIIRLCKSLGYSGYSEFKLLLSRELARNEQFEYSPYIEKTDKTGNILEKIFAANIKTLHDTAEGIDGEMLDKTVELLSNAKNIYIYGIGTSAGIVKDFQYRLMLLGYTAFCLDDVANMKVSTLNIKKGDAAIGISNSGRTAATIDTLKLAKEKGAATVCLTSYPNSEITKHCDYPLVIRTDEIRYPIEAISSRIAHISVLDVIAVSLSAKNYEYTVERSAQAHDLVNTVRY